MATSLTLDRLTTGQTVALATKAARVIVSASSRYEKPGTVPGDRK